LDSAIGFRAGDFVTVLIEEPALEDVALVPATAVTADETVLLIGDDNRLTVGQLELLRRQGDDVIVSVGVHAGRTIVAERSPLLGAGIKVDPIAPAGTEPVVAAPEMIVLDPERRARLVTFVTEGRMPDEVKTRILGQLEQDEILSETVERLERRMGS
jgi:hypothetical protein